MKTNSSRLFYIKLDDWVWWAWTVIAILLLIGLSGYNPAFLWAMVVTAGQATVLLARDRSVTAYSVQLRAAYLLLLLIAYPQTMRWFYWLLALGTIAIVIFGYCFLTRVLSLLPWNSDEACTWDRLRRTFLSAPNLERVTANPAVAGCAGGLCTIEAQVAPPTHGVHHAHTNALS